MQQQQEQEFYLVSPYDGVRWLDDEVHAVSPIPAVRRHLGGRWDTKREYMPEISAYFNGKRRVLVMRFKRGTTQEQAHQILGEIRQGREDLS